MKKFVEKIIDNMPYAILIILIMAVMRFIIKYDFRYDQLISLIEILIWPLIIFSAFIFFRKVFTYLFFSMEEFNFFGNRGGLKNIQKVIEERVQQKFDSERKKEENQLGFKQMEIKIKGLELSQEDSDKRAKKNISFAKEIIEKYRKSLDENTKLMKELIIFRREKRNKELMMAALKRRRAALNRRRAEEYDEPSPEEIDAAGDAYIQQKIDEKKGK